MFKVASLLSLIFLVAACQSTTKSSPRDPAQDRGNGEVGSVEIGTGDFNYVSTLYVVSNKPQPSVTGSGYEVKTFTGLASATLDARYAAISSCAREFSLKRCENSLSTLRIIRLTGETEIELKERIFPDELSYLKK